MGFSVASLFKLSIPCREASRSAEVANKEAEDRIPIVGVGIISESEDSS